MFTDACVKRRDIDTDALDTIPHRQTIKEIGRVTGHVLDLSARYAEALVRQSERVGDDAAVRVEVMAPAAPPVVWEWLTNPTKRPQWQHAAVRVDQENPDGVPGVGTQNHCVHGRGSVREQVVDWKPFDYFTLRSATPIGTALITFDLTPEGEDATRVTFRARGLGGRLRRLALKAAAPKLRRDVATDLNALVDLVRGPLA